MNALSFESDIDKQLKFLNEISIVQAKLFRPGIESEFPNEDEKKQFKKARLKWSIYVQTVEIDIATVLVNKLEKNQDEFEAGVQSINKEIQEIDDTVGFLKLLERGIQVLGKIVNLII
jgi:hypothetical protein